MTDAAERIKALRKRREAARAEGAAAVAAAERAAQRKQRRAARRAGIDVRTETEPVDAERSRDNGNEPTSEKPASDEPKSDEPAADEPTADELVLWLPVAAARVNERHAVQPSVGKRLFEHAVDTAIRGGELEQAAFVSERMATLADMEVVALAKAMWRETRVRDAAAAARQSRKKPRLHWAYVTDDRRKEAGARALA